MTRPLRILSTPTTYILVLEYVKGVSKLRHCTGHTFNTHTASVLVSICLIHSPNPRSLASFHRPPISSPPPLAAACLHMAALEGHTAVVALLLAADASPEFVRLANKWDASGLYIASANGRDEIVRLLLKADASREHVNGRADNEKTALEIATEKGHNGVVCLLLAAGAEQG